MRLSSLLVGVLASVTGVSAQLEWGPTGHATVASIAMTLLNANATSQMRVLLPEVDGDLSKIASWADQVRNEPAYKWSASLHFINTPDWLCTYERARDCSSSTTVYNGMCVDNAIQNYTRRLSPEAGLPADQQAEALKFLVHFVGDIAQPLHVGFAGDLGGNTEKGTYLTQNNVALHAVWDSSLINTLLSQNFSSSTTAFTDALIARIQPGGMYADEVEAWETCDDTSAPYAACSEEWAMESIKLACSNAYVETDGETHIENGFNLQMDYFDRNIEVVNSQIAKAGVRLAYVLNQLFPVAETKVITPPPQPATS